MTDKTIPKTMPERITVYKDTNSGRFPDNLSLSISECDTGVLLEDGVVEAEYVRADLVQGDANEPLEDEQYRWVSVMFSSEKWQVAQVFNINSDGSDDFIFYVGRISYRRNLIAEIGPVLRPPEDML